MAIKENNIVNLESKTADFDSMMTGGFAVVTVMNVKVYNYAEANFVTKDEATGKITKVNSPNEVITKYEEGTELCEIKTLKVANVTMEGPTKTVTGGQYSNPLIKYGKTARLEMQDALGNAKVIEAFGGAFIGRTAATSGKISGLHFSEEFASAKTLIGESFFVDKNTGRQIPVKVIFYQFLPDSLFNLTQDAEGDATVFDLNGDLLVSDVTLKAGDKSHTIGLFYSIIDPEETTA